MSITNVSKPSTTMTNITRVTSYETWDSNTTTWNTETRTWDEMASTMGNVSRPITSMINISKP